jgi:folate-binding protein YgfZ
MTGYEGLHTAAAWFDLSGRGLVRMTGEDRTRLLHAMATNDIQKLAPWHGCYTFFLNAQGRILADANAFVLDNSYLLDTEPEIGEKLLQHLDQYVIADDVTFADESQQWAVIEVEGPESGKILEQLHATPLDQPWDIQAWEGGMIANVSATGAAGFRVFIPASEKADVIAKLTSAGVPEAKPDEVRTVRIENGKPRYGEDITERYLAQETNQMHAVAYGKGCYLGQEIVERVRSRAQIHRMLHSVRIRSQSPPEPRTKLNVEGQDIAEITSAVFSPKLREVAALAYVRVEQLQTKPEMKITGTDITAYIP